MEKGKVSFASVSIAEHRLISNCRGLWENVSALEAPPKPGFLLWSPLRVSLGGCVWRVFTRRRAQRGGAPGGTRRCSHRARLNVSLHPPAHVSADYSDLFAVKGLDARGGSKPEP